MAEQTRTWGRSVYPRSIYYFLLYTVQSGDHAVGAPVTVWGPLRPAWHDRRDHPADRGCYNLTHSIHGTHTIANSLHFHQAFLFTRRCGGREVVWISERAGHFTESRNGCLGRTCGAACTPLPPPRPPIRLRVKGCWEGHIYSRSTRGTCPASKRVVRYGSCMYLIDN